MLEVKKLQPGAALDVEFIGSNAAPESAEPHRHEYYEIFWVLKGTGSHSIDFLDYPLTVHRIYFISPGQVHHCQNLAEEMLAISFNPELIRPDVQSLQILEQIFLKNRQCQPFIDINQTGQEALLKLIDLINHELDNPSPDNELVNMLFTSFLRYLLRYLSSNDCVPDLQDPRILKLTQLIDDNFQQSKHVIFYAEQLSMSSKRVNELSLQSTGKSVTQLIHEKTIIEAKRELAFSSKTVKTIAYDLGFNDIAYFSRFFKKQTETSPQSFRDSWFNKSIRK
ncbi:helix-turn-helix domain-containing protein [Endozoicomonas ascidiicola]|uniref:helix-turn-helix domain-containing protein n=1 Tax=Endozoicomonas ascidiicola TaxID=1698521 RepID=UPI00083511C7|nr:helix-turn-helix domain-containing protein [Endozoicomonas ascidiicola]